MTIQLTRAEILDLGMASIRRYNQRKAEQDAETGEQLARLLVSFYGPLAGMYANNSAAVYCENGDDCQMIKFADAYEVISGEVWTW